MDSAAADIDSARTTSSDAVAETTAALRKTQGHSRAAHPAVVAVLVGRSRWDSVHRRQGSSARRMACWDAAERPCVAAVRAAHSRAEAGTGVVATAANMDAAGTCRAMAGRGFASSVVATSRYSVDKACFRWLKLGFEGFREDFEV